MSDIRSLAGMLPSQLVVTVLPDSGNKYISKIYNPEWLSQNGFKFGEARTLEAAP